MSNIAQYTYLIEIAAISLVSLALIAVITAIFFRQWSGKAEHNKMIALRTSMQYEKEKVDITISEIIDIERETHGNLAATKNQMKVMLEQQKAIGDKSKEIELRAKHIALLENEVKQTATILSERIDNIEVRWDKKLEQTVKTVDQLSLILEENLKHIKNQNIVANNLTQSLTNQYDDLELEKKQSAIQTSIEATLKTSTQLNTQLESLQQKAENAFTRFSDRLDNFDKQATQKRQSLNPSHILFDDIDAIAPSVEEHPIESIDKSILAKEKTTNISLTIPRNKRPHLETITAENLADDSTQLKTNTYKNFFSNNKKKVNE